MKDIEIIKTISGKYDIVNFEQDYLYLKSIIHIVKNFNYKHALHKLYYIKLSLRT